MTNNTLDRWYTTSKESDLQGLICNETTGENIAVTYKAENAIMVASAPEAVDLLAEVLEMLNNMTSKEFSRGGDKPVRMKIESFLRSVRRNS
jgi:hypothetical protein